MAAVLVRSQAVASGTVVRERLVAGYLEGKERQDDSWRRSISRSVVAGNVSGPGKKEGRAAGTSYSTVVMFALVDLLWRLPRVFFDMSLP